MTKEELLLELGQLAKTGQISKDEVLAALATEQAGEKHLKLSEILYYLGGGIVFIGICVLCYQNWDSFTTPVRILVTLGSCLASFAVAATLYRYPNFQKLSQAFFLLFGMLAPMAAGVTLKESGFDLSSTIIELAAYLVLTVVFLGVFWYFKQQAVLLFFSIAFATVFYHFVIAWMVGDNLYGSNYSKVWEYQFLSIGLAYGLLGRYLHQTNNKALVGVLYGFGSLFFLGAALALGGWQPDQNTFWELIYPLLVFGVIFLSVYVKSKSFLVFGALFLIAYIFKLTAEYFTSGLGWPLALVIAGLLVMLIGYYAVRINKKYLAPQA